MSLLPTRIHLDKATRTLQLLFSDGKAFALAAEYLRVQSPSAEVRGHGGSGPVLVTNKAAVAISNISMVGQYALKIEFDDGHASGLYTWQYLHELGTDYETRWGQYLQSVAAAGCAREAASK